MKRTSERGVALVITLIMLALVTFMAVVFLAVSRREKASVTVTGDIVTARLMTDAAVARAQSELAARMLASTNPFNYDLIVSTNYYDANGFRSGVLSPENVNYERRSGGGGMRAGPGLADLRDWVQNIANLQYDARPPVFISTNLTGLQTNDFRFYLDLNRNRMFEPTGLLTDNNGNQLGTNFFTGDPQWIGVLERPDRPHGENNPFVGRYSFAIMPAGKSLDLNYVHNNAKRLQNNLSADGYHRNQGVGSWEINLAAFFAALNTNAWTLNTAYNYNTNLAAPNTGTAFIDAARILSNRYGGTMASLASARGLFGFPAPANNPFTTNGIDYYSDGMATPDNVNASWSGSYSTNGYYDIQELFNPARTSLDFVRRLTNRAGFANATIYDRYTFYRLLAQMGTDSRVQSSNKLFGADYQQHYTNRLHLNYQNFVPEGQTNFIPWDFNPITRMYDGGTRFFTNAADRLLRASLDMVVLTNAAARRETNFMLGLTGVRNIFCCTNIQLHHVDAGRQLAAIPFYATNNEYAAAHRLLQLAANIQDATRVHSVPGSTNDYPSVYRPLFLRTATNLTIRGFVEETNVAFLNFPSMTVEEAAIRLPANTIISNVNILGVPLIIGAKKGYPNFNKMVMQTVADVSRRLEVRKASMGGPPAETNQMYVVGISNRFGVEGWNSYARDFNRNVELRVAGQSTFALLHKAEGGTLFAPRTNFLTFSNVVSMTSWPGNGSNAVSATSFMVPVETNIASLPDSIYLTRNGLIMPHTTNIFERSFRVPQWALRLTNRLQYILIDRSVTPNRIIDYVNLDKLVTEIDLTRGLVGDTNAGGGGIFSDKRTGVGRGSQPGDLSPLSDGDMWNPTHMEPSNVDTPSQGVINQISVAQGRPYLGEGTWRSATGQLAEKEQAIRQFTEFMNGRLTNLSWQVPFTPSRRLYQKSSWEANDPLVHYIAEDLVDPATVGSSNLLIRPISYTFPIARDALLRELNVRYRPWGGKPDKDPSNDPTAYALTMKDPLVRRSDDWEFPTQKFANLGMLGQVHRGTPWQTLYLKSGVDIRTRQPLDLVSWYRWSGSFGSHPTNDWKLLDLFTVAPNDNAGRGLLSVNQSHVASWAAVLGGITVTTNASSDAAVGANRRGEYQELRVQPNSGQMLFMVDGINRARAQMTNGVFRTVGEVLATPELTVQSPYLNLTQKQYENAIDDAVYEQIPRQVLSLLRTDEPRVAVYAFGQALKPAARSLVTLSTVSPPIFNLCTNYQVTGEFASKTVLRLEEMPPEPISQMSGSPMAQKMRAVVESYTVLTPE
jgi:hypothetical protein